jgi:hypothetical protein
VKPNPPVRPLPTVSQLEAEGNSVVIIQASWFGRDLLLGHEHYSLALLAENVDTGTRIDIGSGTVLGAFITPEHRAVVVPAGRYKLSELMTKVAGSTYRAFPSFPFDKLELPAPIAFEVQPGEVAYLGSVTFQGKRNKNRTLSWSADVKSNKAAAKNKLAGSKISPDLIEEKTIRILQP